MKPQVTFIARAVTRESLSKLLEAAAATLSKNERMDYENRSGLCSDLAEYEPGGHGGRWVITWEKVPDADQLLETETHKHWPWLKKLDAPSP